MSLLLCAFVFVFVCSLVKSVRYNRSKKWPPQFPGVMPFIGHAFKFARNFGDIWSIIKDASEQSLKCGGVVTLSWPTKCCYIVTDPEEWAKITNTFMNKGFFYNYMQRFLGDGLLTAEDSIWKPHRRMFNATFKSQVLDGFICVFNNQARKLVESFAHKLGNEPFDPRHIFGLNSLGTAYMTALGIDVEDEINGHKILETLDNIETNCMKNIFHVWLDIPLIYNMTLAKAETEKLIKNSHEIAKKAIDTKRSQLNEHSQISISTSKNEEDTLAKELLACVLDKSYGFTEKYIIDEVITFIVSALETSAIALTFTMMLLGGNQDVQEKACKEIKEVFGDTDRNLEKKDFAKLVYIEAIIKESLRLYPVAPIVARRIDKEIKLKKWTLAAGATCALSIYGAHRHPMWGPDAEEFRPERWLDPKRVPESLAFLAFSSGKRMCIGKNYAMMTMKASLVYLLRNYQIFWERQPIQLQLNLVLKPIAGHHITIKRRENILK